MSLFDKDIFAPDEILGPEGIIEQNKKMLDDIRRRMISHMGIPKEKFEKAMSEPRTLGADPARHWKQIKKQVYETT